YLHTHPNAYLDMLYENPLNEIDGKAYFYQDLSFKKILDFFKTILENDTIYHNNPFIFYRDLNEPLVTIDNLRADYNHLRADYNHLRADYNHLRADYNHLRADYNHLRADYNHLRADYNHLRADYDRLLQNASPLLELSQNTTFKIYYKAYQKSLPLLRAARKLVKK
ncbi:glycosyltransferase family 10 domain-containing protein, partial [Helicobacter pylori]